jgi:hypothetical protein
VSQKDELLGHERKLCPRLLTFWDGEPFAPTWAAPSAGPPLLRRWSSARKTGFRAEIERPIQYSQKRRVREVNLLESTPLQPGGCSEDRSV